MRSGVDIVRLLLEHGADPSRPKMKNEEGRTPLHQSISCNS